MIEKENLHMPMIITVGIVSVLLTVASVFAVQALYLNYADAEYQRKVVQPVVVQADSKLAEQEAALSRYGWLNRQEKVVAIPIDRAMDLVVSQLGYPTAEDVGSGQSSPRGQE